MTYIELVNDSRFNSLVEKYLNNNGQGIDYTEYFKHFVGNLGKEEIIVPVLGIQGAGKSSFLNSILMEDNILPTDVDETTCVPVEVRYGENINEAKVYFRDESSELIKTNDLEKYVHNDYNPANELGISRIVLYNKSDILKNNIVLVDLPGVGSLTPENQRTTLEYVNKLAAGIFMIRTNPPITKTEKNFINALWPKLSNTIFVQNRWNDESLDDADEAKEHNEAVLNSISESHNDQKTIKVNIVNVYEAVKGKFTEDEEIYNKSGITSVIESINDISRQYNQNVENNLNLKVNEALENINDKINNLKNISLNEINDNEEEKENKIKQIKLILSENKKDFRRIRNYAYNEMDNIISYAENTIKDSIGKLRRDLRRIIKNGIVDGEKLSLIYKEASDKAINDIMDEVLWIVSELVTKLNEELQGITIRGFNGQYENISFFHKKSEFKFEKSLPTVLGLGSGVLGAVGTIGVLGGPAGVLVGMGISLAFSIIGDYMRKEIVQTRANYTIKDLDPMIEDLENYLKEEIIDDLKAKQQEVDDCIKEFRQRVETTFKDDMENIEEQYDTKYNANNTREFEKDLEILKEIKESIQ